MADMRPPLQVLYTVDTEVWCDERGQPDPERWAFGRAGGGTSGLQHQLEVLRRHGLRGVFFVEPLFALTAGPGPLSRMVESIREAGQDVQLHVHTEWLPQDPRANLRDYSEEHQEDILRLGRALLRDAGGGDITAFRAGNYGADAATLRALARLGIRYDSSHNRCYVGSDCALPEELDQPASLFGIVEVPISVFSPWPGRLRHAQLSAISFWELRRALWQAWEAGWRTFVIVSHSFELLTPDRAAADPIVRRRFHQLCELLASHPDHFQTVTFADVAPGLPNATPLTGSRRQAALRTTEQALRRVWPRRLSRRIARASV